MTGSRVAVALGSNMGDRHDHLEHAIRALRQDIADLRASSIRETSPVGVPSAQPNYLNAAVVGTTNLPPRSLLDRLLQIERTRGRERPAPLSPRTLDLDLILYGDAVIEEEGLRVPHPRFRERRFVLEPLAEI